MKLFFDLYKLRRRAYQRGVQHERKRTHEVLEQCKQHYERIIESFEVI